MNSRSVRFLAAFAIIALFFAEAHAQQKQPGPPKKSTSQKSTSQKLAGAKSKAKGPQWTPLFDGKKLGKWVVPNFGGEGEVTIKKGTIHLDFGTSLSGITYQGKFPKTNYEVRLEAMRVDGIDFFCGLTFPVADSHASFIVGGWGGTVVGISSIDGMDASENATTKYVKFQLKRWYKIRIRVTPTSIQAWIDDKQVVKQDIRGKKISIRDEVDLSKPLGISAWQTKAAVRKIEMRPLAMPKKSKPSKKSKSRDK